MAKLKIKSEYLPSRCEICHQTDCFDAETNYCSRCAAVYLVYTSSQSQIEQPATQPATMIDFIHQVYHSPSVLINFIVEWGHVIILSGFFAFLSFFSIWGVNSTILLMEDSGYFVSRSLIGLMLFCLAVSFPITYYFENHHVSIKLIGMKLIQLFLGTLTCYLPSILIGLLIESNFVIFYSSFFLGLFGGTIGLLWGDKINDRFRSSY